MLEVRVAAVDVDVVIESFDTLPKEQQDAISGKCYVRGCGKRLDNLRDFHQRYHICDVHIKVRSPSWHVSAAFTFLRCVASGPELELRFLFRLLGLSSR
jgi:hypothetical protein